MIVRESSSMSATSLSTATVINPLIEICKDGEAGFREAGERVKGSDFKTLFGELSLQRADFARELQVLVQTLGEEAETSGTLGGAMRRGLLDLKAALTQGNEHTILVECERGEDAAVAAYQEALQHGDLPHDVRAVLRQQYMGIQAAHDRVRDLRDRTQ